MGCEAAKSAARRRCDNNAPAATAHFYCAPRRLRQLDCGRGALSRWLADARFAVVVIFQGHFACHGGSQCVAFKIATPTVGGGEA